MANPDADMTGKETIPADSISSTIAEKRARICSSKLLSQDSTP